MASVSKGGVTASKGTIKATPRVLRDQIATEASGEKPTAYLSRTGADAAWVIASKPIYGDRGQYLGMDEGVHLDFQGIGVTRPYYKSNPVDAAELKRIDELLKSNHPIIHELGLERLEPEAPRPPLRKWDTLSMPAIKVALIANFEDDHEGNVALIKQGVRYELARPKDKGGPREDLIRMLEALAAGEDAETDAFAEELSLA